MLKTGPGRTVRIVGVIVAGLGIAVPSPATLRAQTRDSERLPTFEVASVKENRSGDSRSPLRTQPGGRFVATNALLKFLIAEAFLGPQPVHLSSRILGGPDWINSARYDITAKAALEFQPSPDGPPRELLLMLRSLLQERFKVRTHYETRELPIYELVLARADGALGPKLRQSAANCDGPPPPRQPGEPPPCGGMRGPARILAGGIPMRQLVMMLTAILAVGPPAGADGRLVVDKTGLSGRFAFDLAWTPEQIPDAAPPPGVPPIDANGPSFFTALQEQLGLKLQPARGPVEVLVIDSVERPTPD
jgi:uncharacterized protein (TIGR03435 family)